MKNDTKNGIQTHRYPSGQKLSEGLWMNDQKEGVWTEWYENALIKSQESYKMYGSLDMKTLKNGKRNLQVRKKKENGPSAMRKGR